MIPIPDGEDRRPAADRFAFLSEQTRRFIERLDPNDLESLERLITMEQQNGELLVSALDLARSTRTVGGVAKWVIGGALVLFFAIKPITDTLSWLLMLLGRKS